MNFLRIVKGGILCIICVLSLWLFDAHCPLESIIGIPCPGCNMSTALYWLFIKHDVETAWFFHPVVFLLIPYLIYAGIVWIRQDIQGWRRKSFRYISTIFLTILVICYVYRMLTVFPQWPMTYNEDAIIVKIMSLF